MANVLAQRPSSEPDFACEKAFGPKRQPFIKITNIFAEYAKENNDGNVRLDYIIMLWR